MPKKQQWSKVVVSVVIADASHMNCQLVERALHSRGNHVAVVGSAVRRNEALALLKDRQPDIAVISAQLQEGGLDGYRVVRDVRAVSGRTRSIILLHSRERELVVDAFRCGARGVVFRDEPVETLAKCIHAVHHGQVWADSESMRHVIEALSQAMPLNFRAGSKLGLLAKREADVARLVAEGLPNRDIAAQLGLSEHTVRNYLFHIFDKLGVSTRVELVLYCLQERQSVTPAADSAAATSGQTT